MKSQQVGCDTLSNPVDRQTVLIVESDTSLRDTYWVALQEAGYRGVAFAHGNNILDVMYAENVSAILLDLFTPGMDGIETLRTIKRVSPEILVVAMGADGDHLDVATQLGADAFVRKPARSAIVVEAVTALTSQSVSANPAERRRYTRLQVDQTGYLYNPPRGRPLPCRIVDMSAGGALIQAEDECPHDRPLILQVDGFGSFEGIVVRSTPGSMGFKFLMGELKRDRLKQALASFAKTGTAPLGAYGIHPNFKPGGKVPNRTRGSGVVEETPFPFTGD